MTVSDIIQPGDRVEIQVMQQLETKNKDGQLSKVHKSKVLDVLENGNVVMSIPLDGTKLVLLPLGIRFEFVFLSNGGMYRSVGQLRERYKRDNIYMQEVELKTDLEKIQRREFYRHSCILDTAYYIITEEEAALESCEDIWEYLQESEETGRKKLAKIVDLSGGGLRINTDTELKANQKLLLWFRLQNEHCNKEFFIVGDVIACIRKQKEQETFYEGRIKFDFQDERTREDIIRYIFEEERKVRQRGNR